MTLEQIMNEIATGKEYMFTGFEPLDPADFESISDDEMDRWFKATFDLS